MKKKYSLGELEEAYKALQSTLDKCEKIQTSKRLGKSQETLLDRRVRALYLALDLIDLEMHDKDSS